jgi:hypothetical protein
VIGLDSRFTSPDRLPRSSGEALLSNEDIVDRVMEQLLALVDSVLMPGLVIKNQ